MGTPTDRDLIQIVDHALAETAAKSGVWLVCKPGCWQCCVGSFAINTLDALRLRDGLQALRAEDPVKAGRLEERVAAYLSRVAPDFPGDTVTGLLGVDEDAQAAFEDFANDEVCPALDPETSTCDVYAHRPMTCRVFGPPVRSEGGIGVCELCFVGASEEEIAACEMVPDPEDLEAALVSDLAGSESATNLTIVAYALARSGLKEPGSPPIQG